VKQEWPHHHGSAAFHRARSRGLVLFPVLDLARVKAAVFVSTGQHAQRAVSLVSVIQVQAHSQHVFQHRNRRLHVSNAGLDGPRTVSLNVNPLANSNREVLVPCDLPVCIPVFIEIDAPDNTSAISKKRFDEIATGRTLRQLTCHRHNVQEISDPKGFARPLAGAIKSDRRQCVKQRRDRLRIDDMFYDRKPVVRN
jgi:hypothetical protein